MHSCWTQIRVGIIVSLGFVLPFVTYAAPSQGSGAGSQGSGAGSQGSGAGSQGSGAASQGIQGNVQLMNPLGDTTLIEFFQDILDVIMVFAVPLIVFFIIYAGFKYVMAQGKPGEIETANKALLYAVIGGVIILGAYVILEVIGGTVDALAS